jgi:hypothetical protein
MKRAIPLAIASVFIASSSHAFESQCRDQGLFSDYESSICCFPGGGDSCPTDNLLGVECAPGWDYARGQQLGEHSMLAAAALQTAGIRDEPVSGGILDYYTNGGFAPGSQSRVLSVAPAGAGGMRKRIGRTSADFGRRIYIPHFAQAGDGSHSLSDFLLGNEHCLPPNAIPLDMLSNEQALNACHTFKTHMGAVNSTHFPPQARAVYDLYHGLALEVADDCKKMKAALEAHHLFAENIEPRIKECENEALALQATAAHYQADAWSTGHMWQRWGTPNFEPLDKPDRRLVAQMVSITSGLIHGWRSVARVESPDNVQHDRMCMPGPYPGLDVMETSRFVRWSNGPGTGTQLGGGDLYLVDCEAASYGFSIESTIMFGGVVPMKAQRDRMMTCLAAGFAEVYDRGPMTIGPRTSNGGANAIIPSETDTKINGSTDDLCWTQRVTNQTLLEGVRGSDASLDETNVATRAVFKLVPTVTGVSVGDAEAAILGLFNNSYRAELGKFVAEVRLRAKKAPAGIDAADLDDDIQLNDDDGRPRARATRLGRFLDVPANRSSVDAIKSGAIAYLEKHSRRDWSTKPVGVACTMNGDKDCAARPGTYCDPTAVRDYAISAECVPHEAAVLNAFRNAETAKFCTEHAGQELTMLVENCASNPGNEACQACADAVVTHLVASCDETSWEQFKIARVTEPDDAFQVGSVCDALGEAGLTDPGVPIVHVFGPRGGSETTRFEADEVCSTRTEFPQPFALNTTYDYDLAPPPATAIDFATLQSQYLRDDGRAICARNGGTKWWHFLDPNPDPSHTYSVEVSPQNVPLSDGSMRPGSLAGLQVTFWNGPLCTEQLVVECPEVGGMIRCDEIPSQDFCIRLSSESSELGWTKYDLQLAGCVGAGTTITATTTTPCCPDAVAATNRRTNSDWCCPSEEFNAFCIEDTECCSRFCDQGVCRF